MNFFRHSAQFALYAICDQFHVGEGSQRILYSDVDLLVRTNRVRVNPSTRDRDLPFSVLLVRVFTFQVVSVDSCKVRIVSRPMVRNPRLVYARCVDLDFSPVVVIVWVPSAAVVRRVFATRIQGRLSEECAMIIAPIDSPTAVNARLVMAAVRDELYTKDYLGSVHVVSEYQ